MSKATCSSFLSTCPPWSSGNGPNYGVAEEAALKLSETIKIPAMHHEGEEFVHGPEMQIVPGYLVFIVDDPQGSEPSCEYRRCAIERYDKNGAAHGPSQGQGSRGCGASGGSAAQRNSQSCVLPDDCGNDRRASEVMGRAPVSRCRLQANGGQGRRATKSQSMRLRPKRPSVTECKRVLMPVGMGDVETTPERRDK